MTECDFVRIVLVMQSVVLLLVILTCNIGRRR